MDLEQPRTIIFMTVGVIFAVTLIMFMICFVSILQPWLRAMMSGGGVSIVQIVGMRLRRTPVRMVLDEYLSHVHGGTDVRLHEVESQYIAHKLNIYDQHDLHRHVENYLKAEGRI